MAAPIQAFAASPTRTSELALQSHTREVAAGDRVEIRFASDEALRRGLALAREQLWVSDCVVDFEGCALVLRLAARADAPTPVAALATPERGLLH